VKDAKFIDTGVYQCKGSMNNVTTSREFFLIVSGKSWFSNSIRLNQMK